VYHPDDPLFARFRARIEGEQGMLARRPTSRRQNGLPLWLQDQLAEMDPEDHGIVPLESNALALRFEVLRPGPEFATSRPENGQAQSELLELPSVLERRLRSRIGELVANQAVEDEAAMRAPRGQGLYHRYNAVLKRMTGNKSRADMTLAELEAAIGWLERNRLSDHTTMLDGDARYDWTARKRTEWKPPVGRADGGRGGVSRSSGARTET
jgi:hypothetical protein